MTMVMRRQKCVLAVAMALCAGWLPAACAADRLAACRLPEQKLLGDVGLGFPRIGERLRTVGTVRFRVLLVDFPDAPATMAPRDIMARISPQAEQFFAAVSYGKMQIGFDVENRWIRMRRPSVDYHFGRGAAFDIQRSYLQEAIDLDGNPASYALADAVLVVTNPAAAAIDWGPAFAARRGFGVVAGGRTFLNGATSGSDLPILGWTWFAHEIGHALSLVDLAGPLPSNGLWHTYVGGFSAMGNPLGAAPEYLGWERWQLGWLDDAQVVCIDADRVVALTPIERAGGVKLVVIPTGPTSAVVVESRRPEGFDRQLRGSGPLVYTIDTALTTHQGAIRVLPHDDEDESHAHALLINGQSVRAGDVEVTLIATDADSDAISVRRK